MQQQLCILPELTKVLVLDIKYSCFHLFSSSLILYEHSDRQGQQLQLTADDPTLADNDNWNNQASSIRVTGPCQWILYADANYADSVYHLLLVLAQQTMNLVMEQTDLVYPMTHSLLYVAFQQTTPQILFSFNMIIIVAECWFFLDLIQILQMFHLTTM